MIRSAFLLLLLGSQFVHATDFELPRPNSWENRDKVVYRAPQGFVRQISGTNKIYLEGQPAGAAKLRAPSTAMTIAGPLNTNLNRAISAGALATAGRIAARASGPLLLVQAGLWTYEQLTDPTAPLYWDPDQSDWLGSGGSASYDPFTNPVAVGALPLETCPNPAVIDSWTTTRFCQTPFSGGTVQIRGNVTTAERIALEAKGWTWINNMTHRHRVHSPLVPGGSMTNPPHGSATDTQIEDAIYVELVSRGMGSALARRLIEQGYVPDMQSPTVDGPSTLPGDTVTSSRTGPDGITTTTRTTERDVTYDGDTATITETTTETIQRPDGSTETTTETRSGDQTTSPEDEPPEPPIGLCDEYPDISACQELGEPEDEELDTEQRDVTWDSEMSSSGSCPPPMVFTAANTAITVEWDGFCTFASDIRPFVIALAGLAAGFFLFIFMRRA